MRPLQGFQELVLFWVESGGLAPGLQRLDVEVVTLLEALLRHSRRRLHGLDRL